MSFITKLVQKYKRATPKQLVLGGVFMLALAGAIGGGLASKQMSSAAVFTGRDCSFNSIDYANWNGGCGAQSATELVNDISSSSKAGNHPNDLAKVYTHFGLSSSNYGHFKSTVKYGIAYQNGNVVVDGQTVMKNAWSIGRTKFSYARNYTIPGDGNKYYASDHTDVLKSDLPVMVMFDDNGTAQFVVIEACGNPVGGTRVLSGAECKHLNKTPVSGKENTYRFTTDATTFGYGKITKYQYFYNDGNGDIKFAETTSGSQAVEKTFTKAAKVTVRVTVSLPGGKSKTITADLCSKQIGVVKKEFLHVCDALVATSSDDKTFTFTVFTKRSDGVTVKSADFQEGDVTAKGVIQKDSDGNIFRNYPFNDFDEHTVKVTKITFTVEGKDVAVLTPSGKCQTHVQREETCVNNPSRPECKTCVPKAGEDANCNPICVPTPTQDKKCHEKELPSTGPAGTAGLFTGVTAAGAALHRVFKSRVRARRNR